jgi:hypothetical protein
MKYKVGDKVRIKSLDWYNKNKNEFDEVKCGKTNFIPDMVKYCNKIVTISSTLPILKVYYIKENGCPFYWTDEMIEGLVEDETKPKDMGEVSDGYHTFNELYEYRMLYNAALFNEFAKQGLYDVHKSRKHSDGEYPFGDSNWFIVMAELPTGQISNHYEMKDWDNFQIPEKEVANKWDGHSPRDVTNRLTNFTNPKKEYPKTLEECCEVLDTGGYQIDYFVKPGEVYEYEKALITKISALYNLIICRDAYWQLYGEEMKLRKPWSPRWYDGYQKKYCISNDGGNIQKGSWHFANTILAFPTEEMRDTFYENFKELINECKELL